MKIIGDFTVLLLGTRGSIATPNSHTLLYGGNTHSTLVNVDGRAIIFDGGTGILSQSDYPLWSQLPHRIDIFLSHYHLDHIIGLPLFMPFFDSQHECHLYGPAYGGLGCEEILSKLFVPPFWPIQLDKLPANLTFHTIELQQELILDDDITLSFLMLNHPDGSVGFRLCHNGKAFCHILDHEHTEAFTPTLSAFVYGCDLMICDASYSEKEYDGKVGFGHSTIEGMAAFSETAKVKHLLLSHHASAKTDSSLAETEKQLVQNYPHCSLAKEGMVIAL